MKKIYLLCAFMLVFSMNAFGQKGSSVFSFFAGYEHFPELRVREGGDVGVEFKHYLKNRIYVLANFHAGINDGDERVCYTKDGIDYDFTLSNSVRDYMLGLGVGFDLLKYNRNAVYLQGTVGIGASEVSKDGIVLSPGGAYDMSKTFVDESTRFAISVSAGYDYQVTDWLVVGVNYTGWQIGYEYKSSANVKLGFKF